MVSPQDNSGIGVLMRFRDKLISERVHHIEAGKPSDRVDLLKALLEVRTPDNKPLDMEYIRAEILLVLLAGADTTATAFQSMIQYLLTHKAAYTRMLEEIDSAVAAGVLSDMPQYAEVKEHLPFYVACVRETMRLCPSAPKILPRHVSDPGLDLYGKFAPPWTEITSNPYIAHRDKELYGEDAEDFRPERCLDPERVKLYNKYNFGFGYGVRACLGKEIATMELFNGPLQVGTWLCYV